MSEWIWYSVICIAGIGVCSTVVMVHALSLEGDSKKLEVDEKFLKDRLEARAVASDIEEGNLLKRKSRNGGLHFWYTYLGDNQLE